MVSNITQSPLRTYPEIPKKWELRPDVFGDYSKLTKDHYQDGWRDYIAPQIGENQRRGERYHDTEKDIVTERVIELTAEEIKTRDTQSLLSTSESKREEILQQKIKDDALNYFQALPAEDALLNKEVYPFWSPDLAFVKAPHKYLEIIDAELVLWEVVQPHAPRDYAFAPSELPALWKRVALPDQILPWSQPLGAHDAYQIGDEVTHKGQNWTSTAGNNVWEPGVFGWTAKA